jgi:hypothetical protein
MTLVEVVENFIKGLNNSQVTRKSFRDFIVDKLKLEVFAPITEKIRADFINAHPRLVINFFEQFAPRGHLGDKFSKFISDLNQVAKTEGIPEKEEEVVQKETPKTVSLEEKEKQIESQKEQELNEKMKTLVEKLKEVGVLSEVEARMEFFLEKDFESKKKMLKQLKELAKEAEEEQNTLGIADLRESKFRILEEKAKKIIDEDAEIYNDDAGNPDLTVFDDAKFNQEAMKQMSGLTGASNLERIVSHIEEPITRRVPQSYFTLQDPSDNSVILKVQRHMPWQQKIPQYDNVTPHNFHMKWNYTFPNSLQSRVQNKIDNHIGVLHKQQLLFNTERTLLPYTLRSQYNPRNVTRDQKI